MVAASDKNLNLLFRHFGAEGARWVAKVARASQVVDDSIHFVRLGGGSGTVALMSPSPIN